MVNKKILCTECANFVSTIFGNRCGSRSAIKGDRTDPHTGEYFLISHSIAALRSHDSLCGQHGNFFKPIKKTNNKLFYSVLVGFVVFSFVCMWLTY